MLRQIGRGSGFGQLVDKVIAGNMIAGIEAVKVQLHFGQLFIPVALQRFSGFILLPLLLFGAKKLLEIMVGGNIFDRLDQLAKKLFVAKGQVDKAKLPGLNGAKR